jgi:hypothetical protein
MKKLDIKKSLNLVTLILVVVVGGVAFFGGVKYQENKISKINQDSPFAQGNPFSGRNQMGNRNGGSNQANNTKNTGVGEKRMGNGQVIGEITSLADTSITVKMTDGSSKIILIGDKTSINKASTATKADLKVGEKVAVFGTPNTDGSVSGTSIQLNPNMPNIPSGTPSGTPQKNN